jgi:hypothetical protein
MPIQPKRLYNFLAGDKVFGNHPMARQLLLYRDDEIIFRQALFLPVGPHIITPDTRFLIYIHRYGQKSEGAAIGSQPDSKPVLDKASDHPISFIGKRRLKIVDLKLVDKGIVK